MCGEPWNALICGECAWSEMPNVPRWFRRCNSAGHETDVSEADGDRVEFFCHDCHGGAGRGETVRKGR
jgi:hypothetical protein